jgi:hypothetical protein
MLKIFHHITPKLQKVTRAGDYLDIIIHTYLERFSTWKYSYIIFFRNSGRILSRTFNQVFRNLLPTHKFIIRCRTILRNK